MKPRAGEALLRQPRGRIAWGPATLLALVALTLGPRQAFSWGPIAHQAVTSKAIDALPGGLKSFYKSHRLEIPSLSPEATFPEEGPERRFAVDRLLPFPFGELPHAEGALVARYGEEGKGVGRLPWLIQESYARLVEAFRASDKAKILAESDMLAGLVADLHNPLALTDNADGQKTGQHGLWIRFTTKLPEALQHRLKLDPDAAHFLDDPKDYVFTMVSDTYIWLDNLLYLEDLARRGAPGYTELYYAALGDRADAILKDRLSHAARDVSGYWYTAWTAAGRPALK